MTTNVSFTDFSPRYLAGKYHPADALSLALACDLAYRGQAEQRRVLRSWAFDDTQFISVTKGKVIDTQCFIAANADVVLISFRGSETKIADWVTNIQTVTDPGPFKGTRVHEGFQDALYPAVMRLTALLQRYRGADQQVWVTGHSLGGALATLFGAMLLENNITLTGLYTFAAPRVGDPGFETSMNAACKTAGVYFARVVNEWDIVPHVPPEPWFSHAGKRQLLRRDKKRTQSTSVWTSFRTNVFKFFSSSASTLNIAGNHALQHKLGYLPQLRADIDGRRSATR